MRATNKGGDFENRQNEDTEMNEEHKTDCDVDEVVADSAKRTECDVTIEDVPDTSSTENIDAIASDNGPTANGGSLAAPSTRFNKKEKNSESNGPLSCGQCGSKFTSRNKLFQHLKQTGHSVAPETRENIKTSKKRRNRK